MNEELRASPLLQVLLFLQANSSSCSLSGSSSFTMPSMLTTSSKAGVPMNLRKTSGDRAEVVPRTSGFR